MVAVLSAVPVVPGQCVIRSLFSHIFNIYIYLFFPSKCLFFYELFYKVFMLFYSNLIYIFMCIYLLFIVCCKVWTLGVWGELACHKRLFNPRPQFSRLGTWCPTYIIMCKYCLSHICIWIEGCVVDSNFFLSFFLSFFPFFSG